MIIFILSVSLFTSFVDSSIVEVNVTVGEQALLRCPLNVDNSTIQWIKVDSLIIMSNDKILNPNAAVSRRLQILVENNGRTYDLLINETEMSDDGLYQCEGIVDRTPKSAQIMLNVFSDTSTNTTPLLRNKGDTPTNMTTLFRNKGFHIFYAVGITGCGVLLVVIISTVITVIWKRRNVVVTSRETVVGMTTIQVQESDQINTIDVNHLPNSEYTSTYQSLRNSSQTGLLYDQLIDTN